MSLRVGLLVVALAIASTGTAAAQSAIGARKLSVDDLPGEPPIAVTVWYPATTSGITRDGEPVTTAVPAVEGRHRLIILSHGSGGIPLHHRGLIEHLVSTGSVVAAPLHAYDNAYDHSGAGADLQLLGRPRHIARSIEALLTNPTFGPLIDPARIGIVGYSAGGYAALVTIGGTPNFAFGPAHCAQAERDSMFCGWMRRGGIKRQRPDWTVTHDRRVRAAVLLAPAYGIFFDRKSLADVEAAVRIYRAADDQIVRDPFNVDHVRRALPRAPEYSTVPGGHDVFIWPCLPAMPAILCSDTTGIGRLTIHRRMNGEIAAFFDRSLGKD